MEWEDLSAEAREQIALCDTCTGIITTALGDDEVGKLVTLERIMWLHSTHHESCPRRKYGMTVH